MHAFLLAASMVVFEPADLNGTPKLQPLEAACQLSNCLPLPFRVKKEARVMRQRVEARAHLGYAWFGLCDEGYFVFTSTGFVFQRDYFNAQGILVAREWRDDTSEHFLFGDRPGCRLVRLRNLSTEAQQRAR